jgi:hypothetical protein
MQHRKPKSAVPTARPETTEELVETDGHWHTNDRVMTTCGKLAKDGRLPKYLHAAAEFYGMKLAQAEGVAVHDKDQSTSRLISNYDGLPIDPNAYRSRTPSDTQIDALTCRKFVSSICPPEFSPTLEEITQEEAGLLTGKPLTLEQMGARFGFKSDKQQSAGARVRIIDVLAWLNWALQQFQQQLGKEGRSVHLRLKS